jgi:hypothetical protein
MKVLSTLGSLLMIGVVIWYNFIYTPPKPQPTTRGVTIEQFNKALEKSRAATRAATQSS